MQNTVPAGQVADSLADRAVAERRDAYAAEIRRLLDAAFTVTRRTGALDPSVREIVREAGLSNQAFYRHFASKDALMLALLSDGRRQLVAYLEHHIARARDPEAQIRRFVTGIMAQARDVAAADATRPFAINAARLAAQFPAEVAASRAQLLELIRPAVHALGGDDRDVELVCELAMARMHDALVHGRSPARDEVDHLAAFCLRGVKSGT